MGSCLGKGSVLLGIAIGGVSVVGRGQIVLRRLPLDTLLVHDELLWFIHLTSTVRTLSF